MEGATVEQAGLTSERRPAFESYGLVALAGAVEASAVEEMRRQIWQLLEEREGIRSSEPSTWRAVGASRFRPLHDSGAFAPMASPRVREALDELLGPGLWREPARWGQMLFTLPTEKTWPLPHQGWHLDLPPGRAPLPGVQLFVLLDRLDPGGGGTLVASGTHRLVEGLRRSHPESTHHSADIRRTLQRSVPWLRDLCTLDPTTDRVEHFMDETHDFEGVPLRVIEMTGEPGDVVAVHPWVFHAPALNCGKRARLMLTERIQRR